MPKRIFSVILSFFLLISPIFAVSAYEPTGIDLTARNVLLVCLNTGETVYAKGENERVFPASITKIMVVTLMLESPIYDPEAKVAMSEEAQKLILGTGSVCSNLKVGEEIRQIDLVYYVLMSSCGDCAYLAALTYGETVENFVDMMNKKAQELGLENTHYVNPVGLHDENHYTTARDTYILATYALKNETFRTVCGKSRYEVPETNMYNRTRRLSTTNFLLDTSTNYFYSYATGVKTGFTTEAGRCLVSTAVRRGNDGVDYSYMCILFGCENKPTVKRYEFTESKNLFNWVFGNFVIKTIGDTKNPVDEVNVKLSSKAEFATVYLESGFQSLLPKDADDSTVRIEPHLKNKTVNAPISKGQVLGTADIIYANKVIGTVNLVSHDDIEKSTVLAAIDATANFFTSKFMKTVYVVVCGLILLLIIWILLLNRKKKTRSARKIRYVPYKEDKRNDR